MGVVAFWLVCVFSFVTVKNTSEIIQVFSFFVMEPFCFCIRVVLVHILFKIYQENEHIEGIISPEILTTVLLLWSSCSSVVVETYVSYWYTDTYSRQAVAF